MLLPHPSKYPLPDLGAVVRPLHGSFDLHEGGLVVLANTKPPSSVPDPQRGTLGILFGVPLERQDCVVVAQV
jgi:hypothetical protein